MHENYLYVYTRTSFLVQKWGNSQSFWTKKNTSMPKLQKIDRKKKGKYDVLVKIAFEKLVI